LLPTALVGKEKNFQETETLKNQPSSGWWLCEINWEETRRAIGEGMSSLDFMSH
jgi:hypothetical protein